PRGTQARDVVTVDLVERREALLEIGTAVGEPAFRLVRGREQASVVYRPKLRRRIRRCLRRIAAHVAARGGAERERRREVRRCLHSPPPSLTPRPDSTPEPGSTCPRYAATPLFGRSGCPAATPHLRWERPRQ